MIRLSSLTAPSCIGVNRSSRLTALLRGEHLGAHALRALLGGLAGDALVLDHAAELAGRRRLVEAEDLDRARPARRP